MEMQLVLNILQCATSLLCLQPHSNGDFVFIHTHSPHARRDPSRHEYALKSLYFFMPATLALTTSLVILYVSSTSNLFFIHPHQLQISSSGNGCFLIRDKPTKIFTFYSTESVGYSKIPHFSKRGIFLGETKGRSDAEFDKRSLGMYKSETKIFHDTDAFLENYKEMNRSLKIFVYPYKQDDPFANVLLPVDFEPNGISGIQDFVKDYITNISHEYPYWNRSGEADHFYVACHSMGRSAMEKAVVEVKLKAIQILCSSSFYLSSCVAHKDASLPQIWPRQDNPPNPERERFKLAFFSGSINSPVGAMLLQEWENPPRSKLGDIFNFTN